MYTLDVDNPLLILTDTSLYLILMSYQISGFQLKRMIKGGLPVDRVVLITQRRTRKCA